MGRDRRYRCVDSGEGITIPMSSPAWEARLEEIFRSQYQRLTALLLRITGDRTLSEELASEALYRLSSRPALLRPDGPVESWLYRTATNLGLDALRGRSRRYRYEQSAGAESMRSTSAKNPLDDLLSRERQEAVRSVLSELKPRSAQALMLRHAGFSYSEIAHVLEVSPAAIPSIVMRAAAEFRKHYQEGFGRKL